MACMKLGSKEDVFRFDGQSWHCITELRNDLCVEVGATSFHLHKSPLSLRSQLLEKLIQDFSSSQKCDDETICVLSLHELPGGAKSFLLVAKFCYEVKIELTASDIVSLRCTAEYLQMTEDYGERNLISQMEHFLDILLRDWFGTNEALEACEAVFPLSDEIYIISRCIDSLAEMLYSDSTLSNGASSGVQCNAMNLSSTPLRPDDLVNHKLPLFKRLMLAIASKGMTPNRIAELVIVYAKKYLPLNGRQCIFHGRISDISIADQRMLIEEIVGLLPNQKGSTPTEFLLKLLRVSMILDASSSCREMLERTIGAQLDQASLQDLLIPTTGDSNETLYNVECVQRMVDHFMSAEQHHTYSYSRYVVEEDKFVDCAAHSLAMPMKTVASLVDSFLAEVASDANLNLTKFLQLAASVPSDARQLEDGIYRAIDIYLEAHPWSTDSEREQLCRLMECRKLSSEACAHAAQNRRLPLRFVAQILFFEQQQLCASVASLCIVSDNVETSPNLGENMERITEQGLSFNDIKGRVYELEQECEDLKREMKTLARTKGSCNSFCRRLCRKPKGESCGLKPVCLPCSKAVIQPSRKAT